MKPAIEVKFKIKQLRNRFQVYDLEEMKRIGFQIIAYGLEEIYDLIQKSENEKRIFKLKDTDLFY